jgi:hypothetical protein
MSILEEDCEFELNEQNNYFYKSYVSCKSISLINVRQVNLILELTDVLSDEEISDLLPEYIICKFNKLVQSSMSIGINIFMCDFFLNCKTKNITKIPIFVCNELCNININIETILLVFYFSNINKIKKVLVQFLLGETERKINRILVPTYEDYKSFIFLGLIPDIEFDKIYMFYPEKILLGNFIIKKYFGKQCLCVMRTDDVSFILLKNSLYSDNIDDIEKTPFESNVINCKTDTSVCSLRFDDSVNVVFLNI